MLILTNFERFPAKWAAETGESGSSEIAQTFGDFVKRAPKADLLMINCDIGLTLKVCAWLIARPWVRKPLVVVDLVLRRPKTLRARTAKLLLRRVNLFVNYFEDITGYRQYYGIGADRSVFVPFKPNIRYRFDVEPNPDGRYVLCLGRSMRDYDTFLNAVGRLELPAAIPAPDFEGLRTHQSRFTIPLDRLPANVEVLVDDGSVESMLRMLESARIVALPILRSSLCASGISTCLNAMLMGKCVILSEGPGASDIMTDQALMCPPEDPEALAALIRRAWEDDALRLRTAETGYRYALGLGGEPELRQRVIDAAFRYFGAV
jgi:glycosyltransferase involved in cell wall biosynthesis